MKRCVRRLERACSQAHQRVAATTVPTADVVAAAAAADAAWRTERRSYRATYVTGNARHFRG